LENTVCAELKFVSIPYSLSFPHTSLPDNICLTHPLLTTHYILRFIFKLSLLI
ncbi:mCG1028382, partial [Mus musculus]